MTRDEYAFLTEWDKIQAIQEELPRTVDFIKGQIELELKHNEAALKHAGYKKKRTKWEWLSIQKQVKNEYQEKLDAAKNDIILRTRTLLMAAGRILGYNSRWEVEITDDGKLHMYPKNGAAQRMWARYEDLHMERELCRD